MAGLNAVSYNHRPVAATQTKSAQGQAKAESSKTDAKNDLLNKPAGGDQVNFSSKLQLDDRNSDTGTDGEMKATGGKGKGKAQSHGKGKAAEDGTGNEEDAGQDNGGPGKSGGHGKAGGKGHGKDKSGDRIPPGLAKKNSADLPDGNPWKAALKKREDDSAAQGTDGADAAGATDETRAADEAPEAETTDTTPAKPKKSGTSDSSMNTLLTLLLQLLTGLLGGDNTDATDDQTPEVADETDAQAPDETATPPAQIAVGEPAPGTSPEKLPVAVGETDDQATVGDMRPVEAETTKPADAETTAPEVHVMKKSDGDPAVLPPSKDVKADAEVVKPAA